MIAQVNATTRMFEAIAGGKINREAGIISGVSAITIGPAKGHGEWVDQKSLETVHEVASEFPNGIKVKFRHGKSGDYQSVIDETCGILKNFSIKGNKVIGDLHLLKALSEETKAKIYEMAEVMPEQFGFSIVFSGKPQTIGEKNFLRCQELQSIDLSDKPAANPDGLFESKPMSEIKYESGTSGKHSKDCVCGECGATKMSALTALVTSLTAKIDELASKPVSLSAKDATGKDILLTGEDVVKRLEAADKVVADSRKSLESGERASIIKQLSSEGRVVMKDDGTAYKLTELETLDMPLLKFAAKNAQVLPTEAKSVYTGTGKTPELKGADGKPLTGSALTTKAWEAEYSDLEKMLAAPFGQNI